MVRNWRQHLTSSQSLGLAEARLGLKKPWSKSGNSCTLVCISSPRCFCCCSWWYWDTEDDQEETSAHRSSPRQVRRNALTYFLVEPSSFTVASVDPNIARKREGENNTQLVSWHWLGDDELIFPIVTSINDTIILSIANGPITGLPDPSRTIRELWGCREEPIGHGGLYARNDTPIFDHNTGAGWVTAAMELINPTLFCIIYRGQQAASTARAQTPMCGGCSYIPLDDIFPPPAEDEMNNIGEESDDDCEMLRHNQTSFPMTTTGIQKFEWKLRQRIIRQQWYLEVIRNGALGLFAEYKQSLVADDDVAWLGKHDHIVNPTSVGSFANRKHTSSRPAAN